MSRRRRVRTLAPGELSIRGEIDSIVKRARAHDARLVELQALVFFSTETGDAWLLDVEDSLALCLARDGSALPVNIAEDAERFQIEWSSDFRIDDGLFVVRSRGGGRVVSIAGYPADEILRAMREHGDRR